MSNSPSVSITKRGTGAQQSSLLWIGLLGLLALVVRAVQLSQRTFYWDDLVIPARFRHESVVGYFSAYDGHVMPLSIAVQVLADKIAPLQFWLPITIIVLLSAVAFALYAVALQRLVTRPWVRVLTFTAIAFSPFLMVASGWWSASLNALGWQLGFAAVLLCISYVPVSAPQETLPTEKEGHGPKLSRTTLSAASGDSLQPFLLGVFASVAVCVAFLFTEKSLSIVPAAFVVAWFLRRTNIQFWTLPWVVTAVWGFVMSRITDLTSTDSTSTIFDSIPTTLSQAIVPAIVGGPWQWGRWAPSQAFTAPADWLQVIACIGVVAALVWYLWRGLKRALVFIPIVVFFVAIIWVLVDTRTGQGTTDLLTRNLHYYADWWAFTAVALAAASLRFPSSRRHFPQLLTISSLVLVISSIISTVTWVGAWKDDTTAEYLANLRESMTATNGQLLDQPMPIEILSPLVNPYNTVSAVTGKSAAHWITEPRVLNPSGKVVPADVWEHGTTSGGNVKDCGNRLYAGSQTILKISNPLPFGEWTWKMNAVASAPNMTVTLTTPNGLETEQQSRERAVTVPVPTELGTQYVRVNGGGGFLQVEVQGNGVNDHVCIAAGAIGPLLPVPDQAQH
ncbi:hypothetical protein [Corynebacterium anserum]|uniref:Uncharacterized protein n=1 Tax=Corynebacterium anserum TaxID=2684406 RepID=A0A7G7YPB4_9CORY|nr:hypothetical protein [Corynebacterium anserum]MBC2681942.1 hypothetical protein [Corynebacterium anserum]QNH96334.1 hypothetical protein GP473_06340 [Corynebacterium anserum]